MIIKPLEKKQKNRFVPKLIFLFFLLLTALLLNFTLTLNKNKVKETKESVLGTEYLNFSNENKKNSNLIDEVKKISDNITEETKTFAGDVLGTATNVVESIASKSSEIVSNAIFDNTIGRLIEQIKKLPEKEQEKIKEKICK